MDLDLYGAQPPETLPERAMSDGVRGTPGRPRDGSFPSPDRPLPLGFTAQWPESICSSYSDGLLAARSLSGSNSRQGLPNGRRVEGELRQGDFGLIHLRRGLTFHRRLGDIENGNLQPNTRERARPSLRIMRAKMLDGLWHAGRGRLRGQDQDFAPMHQCSRIAGMHGGDGRNAFSGRQTAHLGARDAVPAGPKRGPGDHHIGTDVSEPVADAGTCSLSLARR